MLFLLFQIHDHGCDCSALQQLDGQDFSSSTLKLNVNLSYKCDRFFFEICVNLAFLDVFVFVIFPFFIAALFN